MLGLVTTKHGELERKDELKRRIEEASALVDVDQLCLSPQCGFSSTVDGNVLGYDDEVGEVPAHRVIGDGRTGGLGLLSRRTRHLESRLRGLGEHL